MDGVRGFRFPLSPGGEVLAHRAYHEREDDGDGQSDLSHTVAGARHVTEDAVEEPRHVLAGGAGDLGPPGMSAHSQAQSGESAHART